MKISQKPDTEVETRHILGNLSNVRNLYADQEATARTGHGTTDWTTEQLLFQIGKGVRQGCILSPCLFNLHMQNTS